MALVDLARLQSVRYEEKWEVLKPELNRLFLHERLKVKEIRKIMKDTYNFDALPRQYNYHFNRKWHWKQNLDTDITQAIIPKLQSRALMGKATQVLHDGSPANRKVLKRVTRELARDAAHAAFSPTRPRSSSIVGHGAVSLDGIFLPWNMPYEALIGHLVAPTDYRSPFGANASTPSDIVLTTPPNTSSPQNEPSPLTVALHNKTLRDRSRLFISGDYDRLIRSMDAEERRSTVNWLYQFWNFSFCTVKYWGRGPRTWTYKNLGFIQDTENDQSEITSPAAIGRQTARVTQEGSLIPMPSPLCKWSIHVTPQPYERLPSPPKSTDDHPNERPVTSEWPGEWKAPPITERIIGGLHRNDFSNTTFERQTIDSSELARAAEASAERLGEETFILSIVSRNLELVLEYLQYLGDDCDVSHLFPLHLAATYLDGSACCSILDALGILSHRYGLDKAKYERDKNGHTVLDCLLVTVLRCHSATTPQMIDDTMKDQRSLLGVELDICGRWDADSTCYRRLLASGRTEIPMSWKHKFCHTSIQTVCHSILVLHLRVDLQVPSGLFVKRCPHCGRKLELGPYHALCMVAYLLASHGTPDEDLFGIIAILFRLLSTDNTYAKPVEVSVSLLFDLEHPPKCDHKVLQPSEFVEAIGNRNETRSWHELAEKGWRALFLALRRIEVGLGLSDDDVALGTDDSYMEEGSDMEDHSDMEDDINVEKIDERDGFWSCCDEYHFAEDRFPYGGIFGQDRVLGHIHAAINAELLNYRRLADEDCWYSPNFSLDSLLLVLENGTPNSLGWLQERKLRPYCSCGHFNGDNIYVVQREDTTEGYHSNMDVWDRSSFLNRVGLKI